MSAGPMLTFNNGFDGLEKPNPITMVWLTHLIGGFFLSDHLKKIQQTLWIMVVKLFQISEVSTIEEPKVGAH